MKALSSNDDPAHWRQRAEDARREAEQIDDPSTKNDLLEIAAAYDRLAAIIETGSASASERA
jgi:hypothetical protein